MAESSAKSAEAGVRSLKLHCARHTWATFALHAGRDIRWVADQLGHSDPALALRVYAHAMRNEETDLSFAEFGYPKRPCTAPRNETALEEAANYLKRMARREGSACSLRSLVESASAETLTIRWRLRGLSCWRAGRDSNPRPSGSKKNPNPRKINNLRSNDRHIAAYSGVERHIAAPRTALNTGNGTQAAPFLPDSPITSVEILADNQVVVDWRVGGCGVVVGCAG